MIMFNESEQRDKYHSSASFCVPFLYWKLLYKKFSLHFSIYLSFNSCYPNPLHWNCCLWNLHQWSLMRVESIKNFTDKSGDFITKYTLVFRLLLCDFSCCINATLALKIFCHYYVYYFILRILSVVWHYFWKDVNKCLFTPGKELMTDNRSNTAKAQAREPKISLGYLQKHGWLKGGYITEKPTRVWVISHRSCTLELPAELVGSIAGQSPFPRSHYCLYNLREEGSCKSYKFQELPETCEICLLPGS